MHTVGTFAPETLEDASEQYESVGPAAQTVVREVAKSMDFDREEYANRVSSDVVETARDALFASLLEVRVGTREEYEDWHEEYDGEVIEAGSEHVDHVVWHAAPTGEAVAATFHEKEEAAIATLRRQAFGRLYRDQL
ncbi:DUF5809 family protein [Saliphagus sp. GCM10025334]